MIDILLADYTSERHSIDIGNLMDFYAMDPMGGGFALCKNVKANLAAELNKIPHAFSIICYVDNNPAGLVNCFEGFSTFTCKPIVNIHDVIVINEYRGKGLCQSMLKKVEEIAIEKNCCKMTLEVLEKNKTAQNVYKKFGFMSYELDPIMGQALFWQKNL